MTTTATLGRLLKTTGQLGTGGVAPRSSIGAAHPELAADLDELLRACEACGWVTRPGLDLVGLTLAGAACVDALRLVQDVRDEVAESLGAAAGAPRVEVRLTRGAPIGTYLGGDPACAWFTEGALLAALAPLAHAHRFDDLVLRTGPESRQLQYTRAAIVEQQHTNPRPAAIERLRRAQGEV